MWLVKLAIFQSYAKRVFEQPAHANCHYRSPRSNLSSVRVKSKPKIEQMKREGYNQTFDGLGAKSLYS